jgi:hypothetical protein
MRGPGAWKLRRRLVLLELKSERIWVLSGSDRAEGPG